MAGRTFVIGDIHGDVRHLYQLFASLPELRASDTVVFIGDYVDRGPDTKATVEFVRNLPNQCPAKIVPLRGNHEDAWVRVIQQGWDEFVLPPGNGCLAAYRSYVGRKVPRPNELAGKEERMALQTGSFYPDDVVDWFQTLPYWYEDDHAIYVHAGLCQGPDGFMHPQEVKAPVAMLWCRDEQFFNGYAGKRVVVGHTRTEYLQKELSHYQPEDGSNLWARGDVIAIDTGCGDGGFLSAVEFPALNVYESR